MPKSSHQPSPSRKGKKTVYTCSFCHRGKDDVQALIVGPGVVICDKCVAICVRILRNNSVTLQTPNAILPDAEPSSPPSKKPR